MRDFVRVASAVTIVVTFTLLMAWLIGFTPECIEYGNCPDPDDHPTNWLDTALHPSGDDTPKWLKGTLGLTVVVAGAFLWFSDGRTETQSNRQAGEGSPEDSA